MTDRQNILSLPGEDGGAREHGAQKSIASATTGENEQVGSDTKELPVWNYQVSVVETYARTRTLLEHFQQTHR
jgi:hypothetical protein